MKLQCNPMLLILTISRISSSVNSVMIEEGSVAPSADRHLLGSGRGDGE